MHARSLLEFDVLTFDCYGTLIDWETGIWDAFQPLIAAGGRNDLERSQVLEAFGRAETRQQSMVPDLPYPQILARVHAAVADELDLPSNAILDEEFGASLPQWPAFPDSAQALRFLKERYKLVILSNVHQAGFATSNRKLGVEFDAVYTAEDIGSYKPDPANFDYLLAHLQSDFGLGEKSVLHTAQSLYHDHAPAISLGLATAWIDRQRLSQSDSWGATARLEDRPDTDYLFFSMQEMADAVAAGEEKG